MDRNVLRRLFMRSVVVVACVLSGAWLGASCARSDEGRDGPALVASAEASALGEKAEVTPELAKKAEEILNANPGAELGTTVRFELDGKAYIGRFEEHDNPEGEPGRPAGKHKGVTVYVGR
jgi:hypothetical protein